ncbi:hypothetical protein LPJ61_004763, partial [Coemansia biformis]
MVDSYDSVLLGQLLTGFINMAEHQPRRCSLGFGSSGDGNIYILTSNAIKIDGCKLFGGRCKGLVGERLWLFPMESGLAGADALWGRSILKYHLYAGDHSESAIHELARAM